MTSTDEYMEVDQNGSDRGTPVASVNDLVGWPVKAGESGEGLPYAPENWPNPGDMWKWKVGKRKTSAGYSADRYLYLPDRIQKSTGKRSGFASKPAVVEYIKKKFPNADVDAFFASFEWKIPFDDNGGLAAVKGSRSSSVRPINLDAREQFVHKSTFGATDCRAGNKTCSSQTQAKSLLTPMDCDLCCSEVGFCRKCCCILCCKTIDWEHGGYNFIRCENRLDEDYVCGHVAHLYCALRSYMAGTVGGIIGLDVEYYCRRCDNKTDLISHVTKLLDTCKSIGSRDDIVKVLNLGLCILRGSDKESAKKLQGHIEFVLAKLRSGVFVEELWKVDNGLPEIFRGETSNLEDGNAFMELHDTMRDHDSLDLRRASECGNDDAFEIAEASVCMTSDQLKASLKLENEIDRVLQSLKKSQELEYQTAEQKLYACKDVLLGLYQQLDADRDELSMHKAKSGNGNTDSLHIDVMNRVEQIKQEVVKLRDAMKIAKGFGRCPKRILVDHFGLIIDD